MHLDLDSLVHELFENEVGMPSLPSDRPLKMMLSLEDLPRQPASPLRVGEYGVDHESDRLVVRLTSSRRC